MSKKGGFYAVGNGRNIGIYSTWAECEANVKGFPNAKFKKFSTPNEAQAFINQASSSSASRQLFNNTASAFSTNPQSSTFASSSNSYRNGKNYKPVEKASKRRFDEGTKLLDSKRLRVDSPQAKGIPSYSGENVFLPFIMDSNEFVNVYTDGACSNNGKVNPKAGVGVWFGDNHPLNVSRPVEGPPTNNTAEIQAARIALETAKKAGITKVKINTDSAFLIQCATTWMNKWKSNGWKLSTGGDVKNRIELEKLDKAQKNLQVEWSKVPAHSGIHGNEMADKLATDGAAKY